MESIEEVILFCSSVSQACIPVIQVIQQYQLPVKIVRLDSAASRQAAQNGPYFQIKVVPTLVVTYRDGNLQLFVGQPKTLEWLKMAGAPSTPGSQGPPSGNPGTSPGPGVLKHSEKETKISLSSSDEEDTPDFEPHRRQKKKRKPKAPPPSLKKPSTSEGGGLYGPSKKKKKKKKKTSVEFYSGDEGDDSGGVDIEFVDDGRPPAPPTGGLMVGSQAVKPQRMKGSSIAAMAKQMAEDRKNTLGYDDKNLPVYN